MSSGDADIAVVGLGALGSPAFWRLAARGRDVLGFEQFRTGHNQGSTHGHTRLFRTLCLEHPGLVPLAAARWRCGATSRRSATPTSSG